MDITVSVYLRGSRLSPDAVAPLRQLPGFSFREGRFTSHHSGKGTRRWIWPSCICEASVPDLDELDQGIQSLLKAFRAITSSPWDLEGVEDAFLEVVVIGSSERIGTQGLEWRLNNQTLEMLHELKLCLSVTAYA